MQAKPTLKMQIDDTHERDVELPIPPVARDTKESLKHYSEMIQNDYARFKTDFIQWLLTEGKDTYRREGFSESTVKTTHYKVEEAYRWLWEEEGEFTKELPPHRATELLDQLMRKSPHPDSYVHTFEKCIRRLFKYFREQKNREIVEWEHDIPIEPSRGSDNKEHIKDRFYPEEMNRLYEAALEEYSIKSFWNADPDERQDLKRFVSQQQGIKVGEVGEEHFKKASSWKYPSIIAVSADLGLRPIEVGKMKAGWLNLPQNEINIPTAESTKSNESWSCEISSKSRNALENWMQERQSCSKYDDSDYLWLTKYGNQYNSRSLNKVLDKLMERVDLDEGNRTLSYYSFRHGAASIWTEKEGIARAAEQVRHTNLATTKKYLRSNERSVKNHANDKW
ncbi:site-specific integrase [Halomicroarcula sp. F13]|uniref:Site-specific integrase n=1 Tax=Haloarcula rubra TaxID=2487747 RepID=A0AAW4PZD4_9EURY|nr:site-specific integrase [Halomicroarcula rubra]MBX0326019.1 site-specific integrase [Halomicroarcula rubra]